LGDWWALRNAVGVALCMAKDEVMARQVAAATSLKTHKKMKSIFNAGNHKRAEREIIKRLWPRSPLKSLRRANDEEGSMSLEDFT
jgi:hypothetical protein